MSQGKLIVLSAPSGAGKTTICNNLLNFDNSYLHIGDNILSNNESLYDKKTYNLFKMRLFLLLQGNIYKKYNKI